MNTRLLMTMIGLLAATELLADSIDVSGQEPWERCAYCHGIDGISASSRFPHLAGQRPEYLAKQLRDFASGRRANDDQAMKAQAEALGNEEVEQIVAHFSGQQAQAGQQVSIAVTNGAQKLFADGDPERAIAPCSTCHGPEAKGTELAPALAGQHTDYLEKQLEDFATGKRQNDSTGVMASIAKALSIQERAALSGYLATIGLVRDQETARP